MEGCLPPTTQRLVPGGSRPSDPPSHPFWGPAAPNPSAKTNIKYIDLQRFASTYRGYIDVPRFGFMSGPPDMTSLGPHDPNSQNVRKSGQQSDRS